jgi:OOP family OmpA-OmpF porin
MRARPGIAIALTLAAWLAAATGAVALDPLPLPAGAAQVVNHVARPAEIRLATGPFDGKAVPALTVTGLVSQGVWQAPGADAATLDLARPIRAALVAQDYEIIFECSDTGCGGFDFRYAIPVEPEPDMHVDLADFRYLAARRVGAGGAEHVAVLVSRSRSRSFVQIIAVTPPGTPQPADPAPDTAPPDTTPPDVAAPDPSSPFDTARVASALETDGRIALDDLVFASGDATLGPGPFASLAALAAYLDANPGRRIVLVGHTDATGDLDANIALSRRRAAAVADRLVDDHGLARDRIGAEGAGFLAPRATNLTDDGRRKNRRVEAMLASTR